MFSPKLALLEELAVLGGSVAGHLTAAVVPAAEFTAAVEGMGPGRGAPVVDLARRRVGDAASARLLVPCRMPTAECRSGALRA